MQNVDSLSENRAAPGPEDRIDVFRLDGVARTFGGQPVLADIDLRIAQGERVAIIGPSGAGKTTLFRLLSAVLKPSTGRVLALGHDTRRLRGRALRRLRRDIGVLYQNDNLIPHLRVVHNVLMGRIGNWGLARTLLSLFWPQQLPAARAALQAVELPDKLWSMPGELSGGQQQRVAIARLIVQRPRVMLADEPVSQLDIRLGREIIGLLAGVASELGATLLVNLHTLELLHEHFDRVIALRDGRLFWQGTPDAISRDLLRELYGAEYRALSLDAAIMRNRQASAQPMEPPG
ncbi:phosphonate ABC transporter ATP-binding protein [Thioalkalivibrio paradoxus]|uniref:Phosphonate ABC transporter n=1 Tax=Thioalkalivibrio paradoxus ARh 1 TaxID=713585 RepID=W0DK31_9GAMM|nr:ATP-binding cassette domain-containing protein [Thioalkalivibrio paradoxus]AHE98806.1 phosphonate ABC transporter [Thioalkalivibrio paradoxus ARh 1]